MNKRRICILLNNLKDYNFADLVDFYLPQDKFEIKITDKFPRLPESYNLIIPWSYRKIIEGAKNYGNILVIHSSNLPEGRGWAPIYYSFKERKSVYVISGIFADDKIDSGDIVVRASFPVKDNYTAPFIRMVDEELSILIILKVLERWPDGKAEGIKQIGLASYRERRKKSDNEIDKNQTFENLIPHMRGVETDSPSFFYINKTKYLVEIKPEDEPEFPDEVIIEFPGINQKEIWKKFK